MAIRLDKSDNKKQLAVDMPNIEVTQICNLTNTLLEYNWHMNPMDNEATVDLGL